MIQQPPAHWSIPQTDLLTQLDTGQEGLSNKDAKQKQCLIKLAR
jgi:hypothetical protein